jgi:uncharacterized protein YgiM (DUF1202 family)
LDSSEQEYAFISGKNVNCREFPDTKSTVVNKFSDGTKVKVIERRSVGGKYDWFKIEWADGSETGAGQGWIYGQYIAM